MPMPATEPRVASFDGHNDSLTAPNHGRLELGGGDGHIDLPRMRAGGMRGGIFAVFPKSSRGVPEPQPPPAAHSHSSGGARSGCRAIARDDWRRVLGAWPH